MRKRNITKIADTIFWLFIYLLPFIAYLTWVSSFARNTNIDGSIATYRSACSIKTFLESSKFLPLDSSPIYTSLALIFGKSSSFLPFFDDSVLLIFTWFASCFIVHLFVDVILFIPRFAMKWMDEFTKE